MTAYRRGFTALLVACLAFAAPPALRAQTVVVKLATLVPDGSVWDRILKDLGGEWSRATQGRVSLRVYPGGVAGDEPDIVRKMRIGQLQAAAVTTVGLADIDPAFEIFNIPMFFDSYPELYAVIEKLEPVLRQRLESKGFRLLNWGHGGWVYFFTKQPVQTIGDLKKTKMFVWAGDDRMVQLWRQNGFQAVPLAAPDILTGLQTGMIDAYPTTPLLAVTLQWYRSTPNMVGVGLAPLVGGLIITRQAWDRIAEADRAKILEGCSRAEKRLEVEVPRQDTTAVTEMVKRGLKVSHISPAARAEFRTTAQAFSDVMRGAKVPADILELATRERDAFRRRQAGGVR